jgi:mono/diheme cytochrome c family protein
MKTLTLKLFAGACAVLLAACGADTQDRAAPSATNAPGTRLLSHTEPGTVTAQHYHDAMQRTYVAYFGRPADPGGLDFYSKHYLNFGLSTHVRDNLDAYASNATIRELIDSFGTSAESQALYPGSDNTAFITAIYRNMFNRDPDPGGLEFWVNNLNNKALTRAQAALWLLISAQGGDTLLIDAKIATAAQFTKALDTPEKQAAYSGAGPSEVVRAMLRNVTLSTTPDQATAMVNETVNKLVADRAAQMFNQVAQIVQARCAGCHSSSPTIPGYSSAPRGVRYDTTEQIRAGAQRIGTVVESGYMPWGNATGMTTEERAIIAKWIAAGTP